MSVIASPRPSTAQGSAALGVTMIAVNSPSLSGEPMSFRISYTCSSLSVDCEGAEISVPMPAGFRYETSSTQRPSGAGSPHTTATAGSTANGVVFTFQDPLPGGTTGDVFATFYAEEPFIPDGQTTLFTASFSATNAATVTSSATFELNATLDLELTKRVMTNGIDPPLNVPVTYQLRACDTTQAGENGSWAVENATIVDTLPAYTDFVSATDGGVYDPVAHTVTWTGLTVAQSTYECSSTTVSSSDLDAVYLTVVFPDDANDPDGPGYLTTDTVTNNATVNGHGVGDPAAVVSAVAEVTHGFADPTIGYTFDKYDSVASADTVAIGERFNWVLSVNPSGNTPLTVVAEDTFPDGFVTDRIVYYKYDVYPTVTGAWFATRDDPTVRSLFDEPHTNSSTYNSWSVSALGLVGDDRITYLRLEYEADPGNTNVRTYVYGEIEAGYSLPTMTNCADFSYTSAAGSGGPIQECQEITVGVPSVDVYHYPYLTGSSLVSPGSAVEHRIYITNQSSGPMDTEFYDLLPAGWTIDPASVRTTSSVIPAPSLTITPGYVGAQDLATFSWTPPDGRLGDDGLTSYFYLYYKVLVPPDALAGDYVNETFSWDISDPGTTTCYSGAVVDTNDIDQDLDTTDTLCRRTNTLTVAEITSVEGRKQVSGSFDATWTEFPEFGLTESGGVADYRIELVNAGNSSVNDLVAYDLLPLVGDTGVSFLQAGEQRLSEWAPQLATLPAVTSAGIAGPGAVSILYSTSPDPCRAEVMDDPTDPTVLASHLASCVDDWSAVAPVDLTTVTALKFDLAGSSIEPSETYVVEWSMDVPPSASIGEVAWNSFAFVGSRTDGSATEVSEPRKVGITVANGDLSLDKLINGSQGPVAVLAGSTATWSLVVTNDGPTAANNIVIGDTLPLGLTITPLSSSADVGTFDEASGLWTIPYLANGEVATLTYDTVVPDGDWTNVAQIISVGVSDVDSAPGNAADPFDPATSEDDEDSARVVTALPSLELVKETSTSLAGPWLDADLGGGPTVVVGEPVLWRYTIRNTGTVAVDLATLADDQEASVSLSETECVRSDGAAWGSPVGPSETVVCTFAGQAVDGNYSNVATATGQPVDGLGASVGPPINATDASSYFGYVPASIGDFVWNDADGDGIQDSGEPGLNSVLVTLTGTEVTGAVVGPQTTTTNGAGAYSFTGLVPGTYTVEVAGPTGMAPTLVAQGTDPALDSNGEQFVITLVSGENYTGGDSGWTDVSSIGDLVWEDLNGNGSQDVGEPGLANVAVELSGSDLGGAPLANMTTTTGPSGDYLFTDLVPGNYTVTFTTPPLYTPTFDNEGDDILDSDGLTATLTIGAGQTVDTVDQGFYRLATLGDRVWDDIDSDGIQDVGELGMGGVAVTATVVTPAGPVTYNATSAADGSYNFPGLVPGNYIVSFVPPAGYAASPVGAGVDPSADSDGQTAPVAVVSNGANSAIDSGFFLTASVGDFVFDDLDGDGIQDVGEPGLANVTVDLSGTTASGTQVSETVVSGVDGSYLFADLPAGTYQVSAVTPAGYIRSPAGVGADPGLDSEGISATVTLVGGDAVDDIDFGFTAGAALGGLVFDDLDGDGVQDLGEPGIPGVPLTISGNTASGPISYSFSTDVDGGYLLTTLPPASYTVSFTPPVGATSSPVDVGADDTIDSDGVAISVFAAAGSTNTDLDSGFFFPSSLGDRVWDDRDGDGLQDVGEPGLPGVSVSLVDDLGAIVETVTTAADGGYLFAGLAPGTYTTTISTPLGASVSPVDVGGDDLVDSDGLSIVTVVTSGSDIRSNDAGFILISTVTGTVFFDNDADGSQLGEPVVGGIQVDLLDAAGLVIATTTTDLSGGYTFLGVLPGDYRVAVTNPEPTLFTIADISSNTLDTIDSDVDATGTSSLITVSGGDVVVVDAGLAVDAAIGLEKQVQDPDDPLVWYNADGDDGELAPQDRWVAVREGSSARYRFVVTNTGTVNLTNVVINDDVSAATGCPDGTVVVPAGSTLAPGAQLVVDPGCERNPVSAPSVVGATVLGEAAQIDGTSLATLLGLGAGTGVVVSDRDTAAVQPVAASVAALAIPAAQTISSNASTATVIFEVSNTSTPAQDPSSSPSGIELTNIIATAPSCTTLTRGADTPGDNDDVLGPAETWVYTCVINQPTAGWPADVAASLAVVADAPLVDAAGYPLPVLPPAQTIAAADISVSDLAVDVWLRESNADGSSTPATGAPGPWELTETVRVDDAVDWLVRVSNVGGADFTTVDLSNTVCPSLTGPAAALGAELYIGPTPTGTSTGVDLDPGTEADPLAVLSPNEAWWFTCSTATVGSGTTMVAAADGSAPSVTATASGSSIVSVVEPHVSVVIEIRDPLSGLWFDADAVAGSGGANDGYVPAFQPGDLVESRVTVFADSVPVGMELHEVDVTVLLPSGDEIELALGSLAAGSAVTIASDSAPGLQILVATPTSQTTPPMLTATVVVGGSTFAGEQMGPVDSADGDRDQDDIDTATYDVAGISLVKTVAATVDGSGSPNNSFLDANSRAGSPRYFEGETAYFQFELRNEGTVDLGSIALVDDNPDCALSAPTDDQNDGVLSVGESWIVSCSYESSLFDRALVGASVTAVPIDASGQETGAWVQDTDPAHLRLLRLAAVGDRVWHDLDADGQQDPGEPGLEGVVVEIHDDNGTLVQRVLTDQNGDWHVGSLPPGPYEISIERPRQLWFSPDIEGVGVVDGDSWVANVSLTAGQTRSTIDAGLFGLASVGNLVWDDADGDGLQSPGEAGVAGAIVTVFDDSGVARGETTSDANGRWLVAGLIPGTYSARFDLPAGSSFTVADAGGSSRDSDPSVASGETGAFLLVSQQVRRNIDAGVRFVGALEGVVWVDDDRDGRRTSGEAGFEGLTVQLIGTDCRVTEPGCVIASTTANPDGSYVFGEVVPGNYRVSFVVPEHYRVVAPDAADDAIDSDIDATGTTVAAVVVEPGQVTSHIDAGAYQQNYDLLVEKELVSVTGSKLVWKIVVTNTGLDPAGAFAVRDLPEEGLRLNAIAGEGFRCGAITDTATCAHAAGLDAGETVSLEVETSLRSSGGEYGNSAIVFLIDEARVEDGADVDRTNNTFRAEAVQRTSSGGLPARTTVGSGSDPYGLPAPTPLSLPEALSFTGASIGVVISVALLLILLGAGLLGAGRRRRRDDGPRFSDNLPPS